VKSDPTVWKDVYDACLKTGQPVIAADDVCYLADHLERDCYVEVQKGEEIAARLPQAADIGRRRAAKKAEKVKHDEYMAMSYEARHLEEKLDQLKLMSPSSFVPRYVEISWTEPLLKGMDTPAWAELTTFRSKYGPHLETKTEIMDLCRRVTDDSR
jgi:hypothetical protein